MMINHDDDHHHHDHGVAAGPLCSYNPILSLTASVITCNLSINDLIIMETIHLPWTLGIFNTHLAF